MARKKWQISKALKKKIAQYYVIHNSTVRKTAQCFGLSKSYVHRALQEFQTDKGTCNSDLAYKVRSQIAKNIDERSIRGGDSTAKKFLKKKE